MAYTTATFTRLDENADGTVALVITHSGPSVPDRIQLIPYAATSPVTADTVRAFAIDRQTVLNRTKNFVTNASAFLGQVLDTTTPLPAVASTFSSFTAATPAFLPGPSAQDVCTIAGSATRTIIVQRLAFSTTQTTTGVNAWFLVKRSTANSGGTSVAAVATPTDRTLPAATATVLRYTTNPSVGTLVGGVWAGWVPSPAVTAVAPRLEIVIRPDTPWRLVGAADTLALTFGGAAVPNGLSVLATIWWTEG